ncbi:MAG: AAA family ATPase [Chloroflexota bacterium]|nr:AAA family ATPase [Chloroflexota bacterium]
MRIREVRISGFRSIPFCADIETPDGAGVRTAKAVRIQWRRDAFRFQLPTRRSGGRSMLSAIIGANSAGKSTILLALDMAFGNTAKLDEAMFNGKQTDEPVIVEVTVQGEIERPSQWHAENCTLNGKTYALTVAAVWTAAGRTRFIRRGDGLYAKQTARDREQLAVLLPEFRIIWADSRLNDEANLEKKNLISDLIDALLEQGQAQELSIVHRIDGLMRELQALVGRDNPAEPHLWQPVEELEASLSRGLVSITPQRSRVRLNLDQNIPSLRSIFTRGVMSIDNGVELAFDQHGLGLQRSFVVSTLRTWCDLIRDAQKDYVFAIEEPEIYLHPHATRVLLNTLEELGRHDQVIFTTHSSEFVNRAPLGNVLTVQRCDCDNRVASRVTRPSLGGLRADDLAKVQRYLQEDRSDMLFARAALLVEGQAELFALPNFARTLGLDLDGNGVSVVFVNGLGNFYTYHHILRAFNIPHVILVDGDGKPRERLQEYREAADAVYVLPQDFEQALADALSRERLLELMNECLRRRGKPERATAPVGKRAASELAALGKPLVGRVAGDMLTRAEVEQMAEIVGALTETAKAAALGTVGNTDR